MRVKTAASTRSAWRWKLTGETRLPHLSSPLPRAAVPPRVGAAPERDPRRLKRWWLVGGAGCVRDWASTGCCVGVSVGCGEQIVRLVWLEPHQVGWEGWGWSAGARSGSRRLRPPRRTRPCGWCPAAGGGWSAWYGRPYRWCLPVSFVWFEEPSVLPGWQWKVVCCRDLEGLDNVVAHGFFFGGKSDNTVLSACSWCVLDTHVYGFVRNGVILNKMKRKDV